MPYQGVAFFFVLGIGIATAALIYLLREQEREQAYGNTGYGSGSSQDLRNQRLRRRRNGIDTICAICQEELSSDGLPSKRLHCDHSFHARCIDLWAQRRRECPCCRLAF